MSFKHIMMIVIGIIVVSSCTFGTIMFFKHKKAQELLEYKAKLASQMQQATLDWENQVASDYQSLVGQVENLNTALNAESNEAKFWKAQTAKLEVQINSVNDSGDGLKSDGTDDRGEYFEVQFKGTKGLFLYDGFTRLYKKSDVTPTYGLNLGLKRFNLETTFGQDENGLWKLNTSSNTKDLKFTVDYKIDSTFYKLLSGFYTQPAPVYKTYYPLGVRFKFEGTIKTEGIKNQTFEEIFAYSEIELYYNYVNITYYPFLGAFGAGLHYDLNFDRVLRDIF